MSNPASKSNQPLRKIAPRVIAPRPNSQSNSTPQQPVKLPPVGVKPAQQQQLKKSGSVIPQQPPVQQQQLQQQLQHQLQYSASVAINGAGMQQQQLLLSHHNSLPTCLAFSAAPGGGHILAALPAALPAAAATAPGQSLIATPATQTMPPKRKLTGAAAASVARKQQQQQLLQQQFIFQPNQQQQMLFSAMPVVSTSSFHGGSFHHTTLTHSRSEQSYSTATSVSSANCATQDLLMLACQEAGLELDFNLQTADSATGSSVEQQTASKLAPSPPATASASLSAPLPQPPPLTSTAEIPNQSCVSAADYSSSTTLPTNTMPVDNHNDEAEGHESFLRELGLLDLPDSAVVFDCSDAAQLLEQPQQEQQQVPCDASQQADANCELDDALAACIIDKTLQQQQQHQDLQDSENPDTELLLEEAAAAAAIGLSSNWPDDVGDSCQSLLDEMMSCGPPPTLSASTAASSDRPSSNPAVTSAATSDADPLSDIIGSAAPASALEPASTEVEKPTDSGLVLPTVVENSEPVNDSESNQEQSQACTVELSAHHVVKDLANKLIDASNDLGSNKELDQFDTKQQDSIVKTAESLTDNIDESAKLPIKVETDLADELPYQKLSSEAAAAKTKPSSPPVPVPNPTSLHNGDNLFKRLRQDSSRSEESRSLPSSLQNSPVKAAQQQEASSIAVSPSVSVKSPVIKDKKEWHSPVPAQSPPLKSNSVPNSKEDSVPTLTGAPCVTDCVGSVLDEPTATNTFGSSQSMEMDHCNSPTKCKTTKRSKKHRKHHRESSLAVRHNNDELTKPATISTASEDSPQKLPSLKITIKRPLAQQREDTNERQASLEQPPPVAPACFASEIASGSGGGGLKLRLNLKSLGVNLHSQSETATQHQHQQQPSSPSSSSASTSSPPRCYSNDSVDHQSSRKRRKHQRHQIEAKLTSSSADAPPQSQLDSETIHSSNPSNVAPATTSSEPSLKMARLTLRLPLRQPAS